MGLQRFRNFKRQTPERASFTFDWRTAPKKPRICTTVAVLRNFVIRWKMFNNAEPARKGLGKCQVNHTKGLLGLSASSL